MCMTKQECRRWNNYPMSFSISPEEAQERKKFRRPGRREAIACAWCGSVAIVGSIRLSEVTKRISEGGRYYCDTDCASEHKSALYRGDAYKDLRYGERRQYASSRVKYSNCRVCGCLIASRYGQGTCSDVCKRKAKAELQHSWRFSAVLGGTFQHQSTTTTCRHCGVEYTSIRKGGTTYCSNRCAKKALKRRRDYRMRGSRSECAMVVDRIGVFTKAQWKCSCCRRKTHMPTGCNSPLEATLDHVLPLSKGGLHTPENLQLLCRQCNSKKSDTVERPMQMQLAI